MLLYHHCMSLEHVIFGAVKAKPEHTDSFDRKANLWLKKQVGFYPLFLSAGASEEDLHMTGYQDNWKRKIGESNNRSIYRKKGESLNEVLFSFEEVTGVFMDHINWFIALNSEYKNYAVSDYEKRLIFKPSYNKADWLRKARKDPGTVMLVAYCIYLPCAKRVWVRNKETKQKLEEMGFENVEVKRIAVPSFD